MAIDVEQWLVCGGAAADLGGDSNATMTALINARYARAITSQAAARTDACELFAAKHLAVLRMSEPTGCSEWRRACTG